MIEKLLNFIKTILILLFFTFSFVKIYILINKSLDIVLENNKISNEKMLEIEREKAFSMVETEKTKQEYNIKLAKNISLSNGELTPLQDRQIENTFLHELYHAFQFYSGIPVLQICRLQR